MRRTGQLGAALPHVFGARSLGERTIIVRKGKLLTVVLRQFRGLRHDGAVAWFLQFRWPRLNNLSSRSDERREATNLVAYPEETS
jgi:hypothetical protein